MIQLIALKEFSIDFFCEKKIPDKILISKCSTYSKHQLKWITNDVETLKKLKNKIK